MKISQQGHAKSKGGIIIENNVWIGANTVILDGARVCEGSVIAAGSIVRGICNDKSLYGGNPLKKIKKSVRNKINIFEYIYKLKKFQY